MFHFHVFSLESELFFNLYLFSPFLFSLQNEISEIPFFDTSLPREVAIKIFWYLDALDLCRCAQVKHFGELVLEASVFLSQEVCYWFQILSINMYCTPPYKLWPYLLIQIFKHFSLRVRLFCMALVEQLRGDSW